MLAATLSPLTTSTTAAADPGAPPIPPDPLHSTLGLVLEEYAQLPASTPNGPWTDVRIGTRHNRINHIGELPDGSDRLYVPDLNGNLYFLEDRQPHVYLDVAARFPEFLAWRGLGSGFGFVTFHPEFAENGKFYTTHTEATRRSRTRRPTRVSRNSQRGRAERRHGVDRRRPVRRHLRRHEPSEMFRFRFAAQIHAIQQIDFNPTAEPGDEDYGLLYLAVGDGGYGVTAPTQQDSTHRPARSCASTRPAPTAPNGQYGIPDTNPWVGDPGAIGEIWAIGMRDPHRFSWDAEGKHEMFLGHIGQRAIEAVYEVDRGDDFGWPDVESRLDYQNDTQCRLDPMTAEQAAKGYDFPVASYAHETPANWSCNADSGHAISGGHVHRGDLPGLKGKYVFGDLVKGEVYYTDAAHMRDDSDREATVHELQLYDTDGTRMRMSDFVGDGRVDLRFGTDDDRSLYLLAKANGMIWKVVDTPRAPVRQDVEPSLADDVVAAYDFEHPFAANDSYEVDQGPSRTLIRLVNGGEQMRVDDGAYPGSNNALQLHSTAESPTGTPWKAGVYESDSDGVASLSRFAGAEGITVMGWFKMGGTNPTAGFNAIGLAGVLAGNSDGHGVRALLELINVNGELKLVALGRRLDTGSSQTFAATAHWQELLPDGEWVHLAATFDYTAGTMALYRNGQAVDGFYTNDRRPVAGRRDRDVRDQPARHQDRRLLPAGRLAAQPVQLPHGRPDVPRRRRLRVRGGPAVPPLAAVSTTPRE